MAPATYPIQALADKMTQCRNRLENFKNVLNNLPNVTAKQGRTMSEERKLQIVDMVIDMSGEYVSRKSVHL